MKRIFNLVNKNLGNPFSLSLSQRTNKGEINPVIVISREKGSGGRPIAYLVTKKLGPPWEIYHKDIIDKIAQETTLETEETKDTGEKSQSVVSQLEGSALDKKYHTLNGYYKHLLHILAAVGNRGHVVIVGRGANFLFPHALKVRIVSTMKTRIDWVMKYEKISYKEALKKIQDSDKERVEFTQMLFKHNQQKAHHYDIVIRTGDDMSIEDAADLIVYLAKKKFKL